MTSSPSELSGVYTLNEVIEIEALAQRPIDELLEGDWGLPLRAIAFIIGRRTNPDYTLADAGQITIEVNVEAPD